MKQTLDPRYIDIKKLRELLLRLFPEQGWKARMNRKGEFALDVPRCLTDEEIDSVLMFSTE
ncbi:hypothetical protein K505DRAFT_321665 [Melanomma pulvis-pyrius CBS 109.77]|uniref:Uncharacterized protein n=1 Tax=Melanomma pulvis-pyrius CBS 109.77 TaxID=1314802 RepID=A0A6A6XSR1_9PLEO|nr:hypothetical protein K505DRAFT_321665 [Melanomma pulvis-pyrius CBS 109.77]